MLRFTKMDEHCKVIYRGDQKVGDMQAYPGCGARVIFNAPMTPQGQSPFANVTLEELQQITKELAEMIGQKA